MRAPSPRSKSARPTSKVAAANACQVTGARVRGWRSARQRNVNARGDGVGQSVSGQRRGQTQRGPGGPVGNLQQVGINRERQVRPTIETTTQLFEHTRIAECVQPSVPQPAPTCLAIGERRRKTDQSLLSVYCHRCPHLRRQMYTHDLYVYTFPNIRPRPVSAPGRVPKRHLSTPVRCARPPQRLPV